MDGEFRTKAEERAHLSKIIQEWNDSRLDMFALTVPDKDLQFHGVMRFYFQDSGMKVVTKCIRVSSKTSVGDLMDTLVEKFCPDMKMLTPTNYELFECHEKGDTRKLGKSERPLLVQLSWHRDDREGRFLLKSASAKVSNKFFDINREEGQFKRRLSRREKKALKKKRKEELLKAKEKGNDDTAIAQQLYTELPETSLTRSISNPEAVMKRRRQQKLEKRLKDFQRNDGQQTGGTLKIFAETLKPEIPYKTILASINQTSDLIVKDAIDKFQLEDKNPDNFCIVMTMIPPGDDPGPGKERVVRDNDCPLAIQSSWPSSRGFLTFHLRKRYTVPGHKKERPGKRGADSQADTRVAERLAHNKSVEEEIPYLVEISRDSGDVDFHPRTLRVQPNVTVVGSSKSPLSEQYFPLHALDIMHQHCVIANMEGAVTITPSSSQSLVLVDGQQITETTVLKHGSVVCFGKMLPFEFYNGSQDLNQSISSNKSSAESNHVKSPRMEQGFVDRPDENMNRSISGGDRSFQSLSPVLKEQILSEQSGSKVDDEMTVETTFGVDGEIASSPIRKTAPMSGSKSSNDIHDLEQENEKRIFDMHFGQSAPDLGELDNQKNQSNDQLDQDLALLPASLEFLDDAQDVFLAAVISEVNGAAVHFKLAPAYSLYLACHYMISPDFRPELGGVEHARVVGITTRKMAIAIEKTVEENDGLAGSLGFWMANASELLHFLKQDTELSSLTQNAQGILAQTVQHAFRLLVLAMEDELALAMPAFLDPSDAVDIPEHELEHILEDDMLERAESSDLLNWTSDERTFPVQDGRPISGHHWVTPAARIRHHGQPVLTDVLYILSSAMSLLRRCRVNAALTIQLFSQLFHFINMFLFNKLVLEPQLGLCTRAWGKRLRRRLSFVEAWAEKQGLELAAECHLCRVVQAAHLLGAPKISAEDIASISSTCFKLNSLQLRALLRMYRPDRSEHVISPELIESVASVAEHTADELARSDGREVRLDEDAELQLPFLLPEDGYSCDIIRGIPSGLQEFLEVLIQTGICTFTVEPVSSGLWTIHQDQYYDDNEGGMENNYEEQPPYEEEMPEIIEVTLQKGNRGLGLSIVAAKGPNSEDLGIYIKGVVEGGSAHQNGMLQPGDQLLSVNGMGLVGVSQETAAKLMGKADSIVTLQVSKQAAARHGLATLLNQPSPVTSPGPVAKSNGAMPYNDPIERSPTIQEQSPQIRTQRWIAMNSNKAEGYEEDVPDEGDDVRDIERRRREEEEYYQQQEDLRLEAERRREEEQMQREEQARLEEARQAEVKKIEAENIRRMEEARKAELRKMEEERARQERIRQEREQEELARLEKEESERVEVEKKRLEGERARRESLRKAEEQRIAEQMRREEEELEQERLRREEEERIQKKQEEENRKFEQRQREYEERLRIMEEQQKQFEERKRAREEEERRKRLEEEQRIREEEEQKIREERERQEAEQRKREAERRKMEEDKKRREEERRRHEEELKKREAERRRQEEERKRREEEKLRKEEEAKRVEFERKRIEEENLRRSEEQRKDREEMERRLQMQNSPAPEEDDFDDLPPPPEDLLFNDFEEDNGKDVEDQLETRIQNQLAAEREEHVEMQREQQKWKAMDDYEETDIDYVDDRELETQTGDNSFSMDASDVEREFQRRLQEENARQQRQRSPLGVDDDIEQMQRDREKRIEHERKLQLMIEDHDRRKNMRQYGKSVDVDNATVAESQKRMQQMRINPAQKPVAQDDFMSLQRQKRQQQKQEQERLRNEQEKLEEQERQRKLKEVREQKEQEQKMMQEYQRQKELDEQRSADVKKRDEERARREKLEQRYSRNSTASLNDERNNIQGPADAKKIVKDEFKEKARLDYERRRATLDKEVERLEKEKQLRSLLDKPPTASKPPSVNIITDNGDEPPPPRPPPPSVSPVAVVRTSVSPSPSPHLPKTTRFSYSSKTIANVNSNSNARSNSSSARVYSAPPSSQQQQRTMPARAPSRDDPSVLDFRQKMKMFGESQKSNTDIKSTFSRKQREYMNATD